MEPLRLDKNDLFSPQVETYLQERDALRRAVPDAPPQPWYIRLLYSSCLYLSLAGGLGAFLAWLVLEPFYHDGVEQLDQEWWVGWVIFPAVVAGIGMFVGAAEGIMCRNWPRAFLCAVVGLGVGFGAGILADWVSNVIYAIMYDLAIKFDADPTAARFTGLGFAIHIMGRGSAWAVSAIPAGIGQGIALYDKKVVLNGLLGGVLGGLLGGLLFDPIDIVFSGEDGTADLSRCVGFVVIGLMVGLFVGLVEQWTKTAWLMMRAGPLAGKQFVLHRNPTVLGSAPKADIYLFKDEAIEPRHALIHNRGGRFEIEDCQTPDGTYVNGIPVQSRILQHGDQIVLGKTVLEFAIKEAK